MATAPSKTLAMAVVIIGLTLICYDVSAECVSAIPGLIAECSQFVKPSGPKVAPSSDCCGILKSVDVPCLCGLVTPDVEKLVSLEKVVYVARTCGLTVQPGMKCGSYKVPPS